MQSASFCGHCGGSLHKRFVDCERRFRLVCSQCGTVAYRNPRVLVSAVVALDDRVLLCRRAIAPATGLWALPGGFLECGEALEEAAARETLEETGVRLEPGQLRLHAVSTLLHINEVYVGFLAELAEPPDLICGPECTAASFLSEQDVPWTELAYPDIGHYLRAYFRERGSGERLIHFNRLDADTVRRSSYRISDVEKGTRQR